ncbi:SDR family NAD(P)-dependent oxidoreductase [Treponema primitia]|uniref:SDR family NAD(P)-dependent oxidoreductase n=1 Tax=Treponema primitia TaxID=88058 RepID=UPI0002555561|nr:SDR family oxidoreductase [Treponema primitia]
MSYNPFSLAGKTILITGASSGIGRATAIECSKLGATLIITARNEERLNETFTQLEGKGHQKIIADLTINDDIDRLANVIPPLDGLVNNAGIIKTLPIQFINENDFVNILRTNTLAPVFLTQRICKKKKYNRNASFVFISSIGGVFVTTPGNAMYGMSKNAINSFMKFTALEFAPKGIRCNSVNPGTVESPLINKGTLSQEDREKNIAKYPLKRYGQPQDVAFGIIYLLSDASAWVTGASLIIDGGLAIL